MLPILYRRTATDEALMNTNGLGFISKCIRCEVTEELNGIYEVELDVKIDDRLSDDIVPQAYVKCKPNNFRSAQIFRIYEVISTNYVIKARGEHIRYRLNDNALTEHFITTGTPQEVWADIQDVLTDQNHGFTFSSNIATSKSVTAAAVAPVKLGEFMMGAQGSMLDTFGGMYDFNNFRVSLNARSSTVSGVCLRLGAGIKDITYTISCEDQYTHILPVANVPTTDGGNWYIIFPDSYEPSIPLALPTSPSSLVKPRVLLRDFTDEFKQTYPNFTCDPTNAASRSDAQNKLVQLCNDYISKNVTELTLPRTNVKIETDAGADRLKESVVGDIIKVYHEKLDLTTSIRIIKTVYNVLGERYTSIEFGNSLRSLANYISNKSVGGI